DDGRRDFHVTGVQTCALPISLDVEMLQGMAPSQARAVRDAVGTVILYTPVVAPEDFDVAVSYLVRRLEENAQPQNFVHSLFAGRSEERRVGKAVSAWGWREES